jgi:hypothetical protein
MTVYIVFFSEDAGEKNIQIIFSEEERALEYARAHRNDDEYYTMDI